MSSSFHLKRFTVSLLILHQLQIVTHFQVSPWSAHQKKEKFLMLEFITNMLYHLAWVKFWSRELWNAALVWAFDLSSPAERGHKVRGVDGSYCYKCCGVKPWDLCAIIQTNLLVKAIRTAALFSSVYHTFVLMLYSHVKYFCEMYYNL